VKPERFPLLGISSGGPIAIAYAARHPERLSRLILYGGYARGWRNRELDRPHQEELEWFNDLQRVSTSSENAVKMREASSQAVNS